MANGFHITLPPQQAYCNKNKSGSRRPPLTPSTVIPPSLNAFTSPASRRDSCGSGSNGATALLAKVASHPPSPRRTPASSPMTSPTREDAQPGLQTPGSEPWKSKSRQDAAKHCWSHQRHQDGYISFPDYEKYWSGYENIQRERSRERSSAKT